tara:strand:- start:47 stop:1348 length:1302 start_codon:yes stop_codon:yes gene_type:complete
MTELKAKRELGSGRWDKILKRKMTELSVSNDYNEAKHEWIATGEVWWSGNDEIPDWVEHQGSCLCGHKVVYHFQILNTENNVIECVGSDHINTYLIMRAIAEEDNINIDTITDEQIQTWINVRTKSMLAEAWWKSNGDSFEMMFDKVKEIDVHFNVHRKETYYNQELQWNETKTTLRKRSEGAYGADNYYMASVVWRWNHPDNPKAQINTTGYPNDNLMKDLALLFIKSAPLLQRLVDSKKIKEERINELAVLEEERRQRIELRRIEREERRVEEIRIYNLPENVESRRIEEERQQVLRESQRELAEQQRLARNERTRLAKIEAAITEKEILSSNNDEFANLCGYYGIPVFDESMAKNDWEREFLASIKQQLLNNKPISDRQLKALKPILTFEFATDKQVKYLVNLGYTGTVEGLSKRQASAMIEEFVASKGD